MWRLLGYAVTKKLDHNKDDLIPKLIHNQTDRNILDYTLKNYLWYSISKQCYLQRSEEFDDTWFFSSASDLYFALRILHHFALNEIHLFETYISCNDATETIDISQAMAPLLYVATGKKSLFEAFWESIRNSFAHGGINKNNEVYYLLNQVKPKREATVNFLMQTKEDINDSTNLIWQEAKDALTDIIAYKYKCLESILDLHVRDGKKFSEEYQRYIIINDEFKFQTSKHTDELQELRRLYKSEPMDRIDVIISENTGSTSSKWLGTAEDKIRIVPQSHLIETYSINKVIYH